jgi:hypothetical protein
MSTPPLGHPLEEKPGLRERKKLKTRRAIREHALEDDGRGDLLDQGIAFLVAGCPR